MLYFDGYQLAETRRVVVFDGLGVSESLENGIALKNSEFQIMIREVLLGFKFLLFAAVTNGFEALFVCLRFP